MQIYVGRLCLWRAWSAVLMKKRPYWQPTPSEEPNCVWHADRCKIVLYYIYERSTVFIPSSVCACAKTVPWKVTFPVTSLCTYRDVSTHPRRAQEINEFSNLVLHIPASFCTVIDGCVLFREIIGVVVNSAFPKDWIGHKLIAPPSWVDPDPQIGKLHRWRIRRWRSRVGCLRRRFWVHAL